MGCYHSKEPVTARRGRAEAAASPAPPPPPIGQATEPGAPFRPDLSGPPLPPCDQQRAEIAEALLLLDPPTPAFESLLDLAAGILGCKAALIALFGDKRIWIKHAKNFEPGDFPWRQSFCAWTCSYPTPQPLVVFDAHSDARFKSNPAVTSGMVGFYAGTPLIAPNGHRLGTLCCADPSPRVIDESQCLVLANFADMVVAELLRSAEVAGQRRDQAARAADAAALAKALGVAAGAAPRAPAGRTLVVDAGGGGLAVVHASAACCELFEKGEPDSPLIGRPLWSLFDPSGAPGRDAARRSELAASARVAMAEGHSFLVRGVTLSASPGDAYDLTFRPVAVRDPTTAPALALPTFVPAAGAGAAHGAASYYFVSIDKSTWLRKGLGGSGRGPASGAALTPALGTGTPPEGQGGVRRKSGASSATNASERRSGFLELGRRRAPIEGLELGPQIACGSYGRVFKGAYFGARVAVKVLESTTSAWRDPETGASLEAALSHGVSHPLILQTLAWATVRGEDALPLPDAGQMVGTVLGPGGGDDASFTTAGSDSTRNSGPSGCGDSSSCGEGLFQTWIVMEYADAGCLQDAIDRGYFATDPTAAIITAREIAAAMAHLHRGGVVHADLSAWNVLLAGSEATALDSRGFSARVADFGLARAVGPAAGELTASYGTLSHAAPEALEHGLVSRAGDVYSFGVLLWQMLFCSRPWAGMSHAAIVKAVVQDRRGLIFPSPPPGGEPEPLAMLAEACLARAPAARPTFEELVAALSPLNDAIESASHTAGIAACTA
ncbi:hypothetical protein Rsub_08949 [Raphidocelis subcapitata]|uniref:Protein kinase domain-containing protein n=1 Tax=Raphidocelis subcapitata TaxID=307507 RepID=A0A2V0PDV2_9CHLO|nr:hypothetical protein Rsub_08949 [Raphidocelis subcapitata]|eukprot:GBF96073.1 hypothetical protein Rsub_08949 [Raphidocelis subcapitata]